MGSVTVADRPTLAIDSKAVSKVGGRWVSAGALATLVAACSRPPLGEFCPDVDEGDLVITEIRGPQTGGDTRGQWFEVYNATDRTVDLRGLRVNFYDLQGARQPGDRVIVVRAAELLVDPGAYVTLGHHDPAKLPAFVDATFIVDYFRAVEDADEDDLGFGDTAERRPRDLVPAGRIELEACDTVIDSLSYRALPDEGTLSFDGSLEPDAEANDDEKNFCVDSDAEVLEPGEPQLYIGLPGTPQEANRPCFD